MLNSNALEQLSQLKQEIRANKDFAQGLVRGSKGRFGFVVLDDEREAFLNPEQMQKVFPGDRVEVSITKNEKDQLEATLEKLISSELSEFVGSYLDRGKAHFVVPDVHMLSRWIFLAPKNRAGAKGGDYIRCKITRHPFQDGKGQAKVIEIIGKPNDDFVERKYIVSKFQLPDQWTDTQQQQASALQQDATPNDDVAHLRQDLTHLPFVTIDAATTKDMDDAIYAESKENGWQLYVAIADPSAGIALDSPLGQEAIKRAQTVYLPGKSAPMIPHELANGSYSLVEGEQRPALVSTLKIGTDGGVETFSLATAWVKSAAKLTYEQVSEYVDGDINTAPLDENVRNSLAALNAVSKARFAYREQNALVMEDRPDYDYKVDELGKIVDIVKTNRNSAQRIVEEAMLVTNNSAGAYLNQHSIAGLYSSHAGFKPDRLSQVNKLLEEDLGEIPEGITELKGYVALIQKLQTTPELSGLLTVLKRQLRPSELSAEPAPHLGLGFETYATITSPIRRINDLYNHIALKHHLQNSSVSNLAEEQLANVKEQLSTGRMACRQLEQWLVCQYMQQFVGQSFAGIVAMINSQGVGVRLSDNGVDTFVQLRDRKNKEQKIEFSPERLTLVVDGKQFNFDDEVTVTITGVDQERRQVLATLGNDGAA